MGGMQEAVSLALIRAVLQFTAMPRFKPFMIGTCSVRRLVQESFCRKHPES